MVPLPPAASTLLSAIDEQHCFLFQHAGYCSGGYYVKCVLVSQKPYRSTLSTMDYIYSIKHVRIGKELWMCTP